MLAELSPAIASTIGFVSAGLVVLFVLLWTRRRDRDEVVNEPEFKIAALERPRKERVLAILKELTDDEEESELLRVFAYCLYEEVSETGKTENADEFLAALHPAVSVWYGMPEY